MYSFIRLWMGVFSATVAVLFAVGLVPQKGYDLIEVAASIFVRHEATAAQTQEQTEREEIRLERPTRIVIPSANIDFDIVLPATTDISDLDQALSQGVVHYPGSGILGDTSNMLLFGHSSHLRHVRNPAYKALTGIDAVKPGDMIEVVGETSVFRYIVESVRIADKDEELVTFSTGRAELTISTCDTFGAKDDRYVIKAVFAERVEPGEPLDEEGKSWYTEVS